MDILFIYLNLEQIRSKIRFSIKIRRVLFLFIDLLAGLRATDLLVAVYLNYKKSSEHESRLKVNIQYPFNLRKKRRF